MREHDLPLGARVRTADNREVGAVDAVLGDYFKLGRGADEAIWLPRDTVATVDGLDVVLDFRSDAMIEHRVPAPPDRYQESAYLRGDLTEDEQEQRETMLAELAEQRREMSENDEVLSSPDSTVGIPVEQELERMQAGQGHESHEQHERDEHQQQR